MNVFCLLYGHTWVHEAEEARVRWNNNKDLNQLLRNKTEGGDEGELQEPRFFRRCVRCGERRPWSEQSA